MTNEHTVKAYSLKQISEWQTEIQPGDLGNVGRSRITLPSLQRGFIWKPHQIEDLWDSILRGFPIGAVLMSKDGYFGVMVPVISVKPCHLKDHTMI